MRKILLMAASAALALGSAAASATAITSTFTASGVTDSVSQQATAQFSFLNANTLSITLTDNVSPTADLLSELVGLTFSFSSAPTDVQLTQIVPTSIVDCTSSKSPCPTGSGTYPYGWGGTLNGSQLSIGAGFDGTSLFAHQPYGIVNANYTAPGGDTGLSSAANNPLLIGPVTFTFGITGLESIPEIMGVSFAFGTQPANSQPGVAAVPEPRPVALLGIGLVGIWLVRRRRRA